MQHNTTCNLDFNEGLTLHRLENRLYYLLDWTKEVQKKPHQTEFMADTLCKILDEISEIRDENKPEIYKIFEKFDTLASSVKGLPK